MSCAGDKLRVCGATLAAGAPAEALVAARTALLHLHLNGTHRCACCNPKPCAYLSQLERGTFANLYHSPIACLLRAPCCPHSTPCRAWSSSHDTGNPPTSSCAAQRLFQAHCATRCKHMLGSDQRRMWQSACCHAPGLDAQPRRVHAAGRSAARRRHRPSHAGGHPAAPAGYSYHVLCLPGRVVGFMRAHW